MNIPQSALASLFPLSTRFTSAKTGITSYRLADNTGEDWEPAILNAPLTPAIECFLLLTFLACNLIPCLLRAKPESGGSQRQEPSFRGPFDDG